MPARCQQSCALLGFAGAIPFLTRNPKPMGSGGSTVTRLKLKGVDAMTPQGVEYAAQFDNTGNVTSSVLCSDRQIESSFVIL